MSKKYKSVWDAVMDSPQEALNMKLRSSLMLEIENAINKHGWSQTEAAKHLGVSQPRVSDLLRGKIKLFSLDMLVNMLAAMGSEVELRVA